MVRKANIRAQAPHKVGALIGDPPEIAGLAQGRGEPEETSWADSLLCSRPLDLDLVKVVLEQELL